jgi:hypothetical protein
VLDPVSIAYKGYVTVSVYVTRQDRPSVSSEDVESEKKKPLENLAGRPVLPAIITKTFDSAPSLAVVGGSIIHSSSYLQPF